MSKLKKTLAAFKEIAKNPWLLNNVLNDNIVWQRKVEQKYGLGKGLPTVSLDTLFPNFEENLTSFSFLGGGSLPTDIALLKSLCKRKENALYFEIGTWRGESVFNVAEVAKECYTLNLSKEDIISFGLPKEYAEAHAYFSKNLQNVKHITGNSLQFDFAGLQKKFDVIFIDGSHHFEDIIKDTQNVFQHLVHESSVVVWHDYAYDPESLRFEVLHAILDALPKEEHQNLYHVGNSMCAIYTKEKLITQPFTQFMQPTSTYEVNIKVKKL